MLVDELGLEPGAALQELERAILRQDASLAAPAQPNRAPRRATRRADTARRAAARGRRRSTALLPRRGRAAGDADRPRRHRQDAPRARGRARRSRPSCATARVFVDLAPVAAPDARAADDRGGARRRERATGRSGGRRRASPAAAAAARARQLRAAAGGGAGRRRVARGARRGCSSWRRAARRCDLADEHDYPVPPLRGARRRSGRSRRWRQTTRCGSSRPRARAVDRFRSSSTRRTAQAVASDLRAGSTGCRWRSSSLPPARSCSLPRRDARAA